MIWDNDIRLIVMLCPLKSEHKEESIPYWDRFYQNRQHRIRVTWEHKEILQDKNVIKRTLILRRKIRVKTSEEIKEN